MYLYICEFAYINKWPLDRLHKVLMTFTCILTYKYIQLHTYIHIHLYTYTHKIYAINGRIMGEKGRGKQKNRNRGLMGMDKGWLTVGVGGDSAMESKGEKGWTTTTEQQ